MVIKNVDIADLISNHHSVGIEHEEMLRTLTEKYPFAQTFPLLLISSFRNNDSIELDEKLKEYAFRISDRRHLYQLIQEKDRSPQVHDAELELTIEEKEITSTTTVPTDEGTLNSEVEDAQIPEDGEKVAQPPTENDHSTAITPPIPQPIIDEITS